MAYRVPSSSPRSQVARLMFVSGWHARVQRMLKPVRLHRVPPRHLLLAAGLAAVLVSVLGAVAAASGAMTVAVAMLALLGGAVAVMLSVLLLEVGRLRFDARAGARRRGPRGMGRRLTRTRKLVLARLDNQQAQLQALVSLVAMTPVRAPLPRMGGWAASPDLLLVLVRELIRLRPATVVECGSGASTLWLALTVERLGLPTRIVTLEHDAEYLEETRLLLEDHGVAAPVDLRLAPLTELPAESGLSGIWYDTAAVADLHDVGLLFVDGPPANIADGIRLPAVPVLRHCFAPTCTIVLDDFERDDEQRVAAAWRTMLPDFAVEDLPLEKGACVLRRG